MGPLLSATTVTSGERVSNTPKDSVENKSDETAAVTDKKTPGIALYQQAIADMKLEPDLKVQSKAFPPYVWASIEIGYLIVDTDYKEAEGHSAVFTSPQVQQVFSNDKDPKNFFAGLIKSSNNEIDKKNLRDRVYPTLSAPFGQAMQIKAYLDKDKSTTIDVVLNLAISPKIYTNYKMALEAAQKYLLCDPETLKPTADPKDDKFLKVVLRLHKLIFDGLNNKINPGKFRDRIIFFQTSGTHWLITLTETVEKFGNEEDKVTLKSLKGKFVKSKKDPSIEFFDKILDDKEKALFEKFEAPHPSKIMGLMRSFSQNLKKYYQDSKWHPVALAAWVHITFIKIHPFTDGNGRIARILMQSFLVLKKFRPVVFFEDSEDSCNVKYSNMVIKDLLQERGAFARYLANEVIPQTKKCRRMLDNL